MHAIYVDVYQGFDIWYGLLCERSSDGLTIGVFLLDILTGLVLRHS